MQVILKSEIEKLGKVGEVVKVKPGYARNYLLPQGLAYMADSGSLKKFADEKRQLLARADREMSKAETLKTRLEALEYTAHVKVGSEGRLYGSVTTHDVHALVSATGVEFPRRDIILEKPIKTLGDHEVHIRLYGGLHAVVKLHVKDQEAEVKAAIEAEIAAAEAAEEAERAAARAEREAAEAGDEETENTEES